MKPNPTNVFILLYIINQLYLQGGEYKFGEIPNDFKTVISKFIDVR